MSPSDSDVLELFDLAVQTLEDLRSKMKTAHEMVQHQERSTTTLAAAAEALTRTSEMSEQNAESAAALISDLRHLAEAVLALLGDEDRSVLSATVADLRTASDTNSRFLYQEMQTLRASQAEISKHQDTFATTIESQQSEIASLRSQVASLEAVLQESELREESLRGQLASIPPRTLRKHGLSA